MRAALFYGCLVAVAVLLSSCSGKAFRWTPDYYQVQSGDTLYSIAHRYDLDHRQLAAWNGLGSGSIIRPGQKLRLSPPSGGTNTTSAGVAKPPDLPAPRFLWPTAGQVTLRFGQSAKTGSGVRIAGQRGQTVQAIAAGEVVYAGGGLASYGQLLIIKHNQTWLSAYGFNDPLLVSEGQKVAAGQKVARMGEDLGGNAVLHFEIRKNGQPVDPLRYLPRR